MKETFLCSVLFRLAAQLIYIDDRNFCKTMSVNIFANIRMILIIETHSSLSTKWFFFSTYIELNRHAAEVDMP